MKGIKAAIAIDNDLLAYRDRQSLLISLSKEITSCRTKDSIREIVNTRLGSIFQYNAFTVSLVDDNGINHSNYLYSLPQEMLNHPELAARAAEKYFVEDIVYKQVLRSNGPVIFDMDELMRSKSIPGYVDFFYKNGIREMVAFPIWIDHKSIGGVFIHSKVKNAFTPDQLELADAVCAHIAIAVANVKAYDTIKQQLEEINTYKTQLEQENIYLREQIKTGTAGSEIVGNSIGLRNIFQLLAQVAPSDSTVLLLGETGTGKELIAKAIHNASPRNKKLMIRVNCAALPANLIESELFGHERGSFTGASERRIGKFELANHSTLFLDEIGEMPPDLQVKLLRAIQEKEIERIGGRDIIKTNVRIIAATNRDLYKEVELGRFRSDLYYRLNVFPITLPPLRDRKEDIPMLVSYFIQKFSKSIGKQFTKVSAKVLKKLDDYHWPGNVRELEHVVERSALMTNGSVISEVYLPTDRRASLTTTTTEIVFRSLEENEREYILAVLKKTNGKVRGEDGAAKILKLPPTTLHSKMKKLGIKKDYQ